MNLDHHHCYTVIQSRDARFDGLFFTGVKTTGIFCRPICPANTPHRENVQFYASAAEASEAGFRPCRRCRPELSPDTPEWRGISSSVVSRALRLIAGGILEEGRVQELADHLNLSTRQLRRHFVKELGIPPIAVAQTRRLLLAKQLIDDTPLSMAEVAFSAGYSSIRQFNHAFQHTYGVPPSELRKRRPQEDRAAAKTRLELKLFYRTPYHWQAMQEFLAARAIPGIVAIREDCYQRTVRFEETVGVISVRYIPGERYLLLCVPLELSRHLREIIERTKRLFDLKAAPEIIAQHLKTDSRLAEAIEGSPGLRVPGAWDGFETAIRAILGQQVSVKAATTISGRLVQAYGQPLEAPIDELSHVFPRPEQLAEASLDNIGIPRKRAEAIRTLARAVVEKQLNLRTSPSLEHAVEALKALPGFGPWTANYIAMRVFGEPDAFPDGDLILRRSAAENLEVLKPRELLAHAETWRPWRAYATMYLWRHYNHVAQK